MDLSDHIGLPFIGYAQKYVNTFLLLSLKMWSYRLTVRTPGSHPGNSSSILDRITKIIKYTKSFSARGLSSLSYKGSWYESRLSWIINASLWESYDPDDNFYYPSVSNWDDILQRTIDNNKYEALSKDEILSILFGLHHRNRIIDGLWTSMFERGVSQKLIERLPYIDTE